MGASYCCQRRRDIEQLPSSIGCRCRCCCCRGYCCRSYCCFGMRSIFHPSTGEHAAASSLHHASPSQSVGLLGRPSTGMAVPTTFHPPPNLTIQIHGNVLGPEKYGSSPLHEGNPENVQQSTVTSGGDGLVVFQQAKGAGLNEEKKDADEISMKFQKSKNIDCITLLVDDEDNCPICLEDYDLENPKINTQCEHHFHLGCILEWMERSDTCPVCDKEMVLSESV